MKNSLDVQRVLKIFQIIVEKGQQTSDGHKLNGINAASDFDGYNLDLWDDQVRLTIFFHNKYEVDFKNKFTLDDFYEKLFAIEKLA